MKLREALDNIDSITTDPASRVYGQPYETVDGVTIVPVAKVRGRTRPGAGDAELRLNAKPVGVFVIKNGEASWVPAVDVTRIALMGELIGLVSATLATLAMVHRPPWPDVKGTIYPGIARSRQAHR
jgi:hypothetical protein